MPVKADWFPLHCSRSPWVSSAFSLPVVGWGCCLLLYTDPNSAVISRFQNVRSCPWSSWSSGTLITLKPQAEYCQLPFSRQGSSMGIGRQSFPSTTCEQYWESKGEEIWRLPSLHPVLLVFDFTLFGSDILKHLLVVPWNDWMSFVRRETRFVTVSFLKSESKVTERTNLYSTSHWFRATYKSSGRISKLALSFIKEHCLALTLLDCVFSFAFPIIKTVG